MNHQFAKATIFLSILYASSAFNFNVNWVQNPKESLNAWSSRMRFQINDNLVFKMDNKSAPVLVVKKEDFDSCSSSNPIGKVQGGSFQLTRSGPYYFISGDAQECMNGQKMMVVVLSPRGKKPVVATPMSSPTMSPPSSSMAPPLTPPSMTPSSSMAPSMTPSSSMAPSMTPSSSMAPSMAPSSSSMAPSSSSMAPMPFTAGTMPGPAGSEGPASAPKAMSAGSALGAASVTIVIAIVGSVVLA